MFNSISFSKKLTPALNSFCVVCKTPWTSENNSILCLATKLPLALITIGISLFLTFSIKTVLIVLLYFGFGFCFGCGFRCLSQVKSCN